MLETCGSVGDGMKESRGDLPVDGVVEISRSGWASTLNDLARMLRKKPLKRS
jgi:hypothetical protein